MEVTFGRTPEGLVSIRFGGKVRLVAEWPVILDLAEQMRAAAATLAWQLQVEPEEFEQVWTEARARADEAAWIQSRRMKAEES